MPAMVRIPQRTFVELVDRTLARARIGPALDDAVKRRLRALANAADDIEHGSRKGTVVLQAADAEWLQQRSATSDVAHVSDPTPNPESSDG